MSLTTLLSDPARSSVVNLLVSVLGVGAQ